MYPSDAAFNEIQLCVANNESFEKNLFSFIKDKSTIIL